jgi:hypothetical protein
MRSPDRKPPTLPPATVPKIVGDPLEPETARPRTIRSYPNCQRTFSTGRKAATSSVAADDPRRAHQGTVVSILLGTAGAAIPGMRRSLLASRAVRPEGWAAARGRAIQENPQWRSKVASTTPAGYLVGRSRFGERDDHETAPALIGPGEPMRRVLVMRRIGQGVRAMVSPPELESLLQVQPLPDAQKVAG